MKDSSTKVRERAVQTLERIQARAVAQKDSMLEGSLINAIAEVTGKQSPNRYKCP